MVASEWVPYQSSTFVTPAFPGYVSGHSTFSRAAAVILTELTGDAYFPGGMYEHRVPARALEFDEGPGEEVILQWATYYDAADEAGRSRIFGGIHIEADDFGGRRLGDSIGRLAWETMQPYLR